MNVPERFFSTSVTSSSSPLGDHPVAAGSARSHSPAGGGTYRPAVPAAVLDGWLGGCVAVTPTEGRVPVAEAGVFASGLASSSSSSPQPASATTGSAANPPTIARRPKRRGAYSPSRILCWLAFVLTSVLPAVFVASRRKYGAGPTYSDGPPLVVCTSGRNRRAPSPGHRSRNRSRTLANAKLHG